MSEKVTVRDKFFEFLSTNDPMAIANLARDHQDKIPFIQLPILDRACTTLADNKDTACLRALIDYGFQIFICSSDYGTKEIGLDPPITRLLGDVVAYEPDHDIMQFLSELFAEHFNTYVEQHADPNCELSRSWIQTLEQYRQEIVEFNRNPKGFSEYLSRLDGAMAGTSPASKLKRPRPR